VEEEDVFIAEVTDAEEIDGWWTYSFKEKITDADGAYADAEPGRVGTADDCPAYELNNQEVAVGSLVKLYPKGWEGGLPAYEFAGTIGTAPGASITVSDGTTDYPGTQTITVDPAEGFALSGLGIDSVQIMLLAASATRQGTVSTTTQAFAGDKTFNDDVTVLGDFINTGSARVVATNPSFSLWYTYASSDLRVWQAQVCTDIDTSPTGQTIPSGLGISEYSLTTENSAGLAVRHIGTATHVIAFAASGTAGYSIVQGATRYDGGTATTGGLTFRGGLYVSGTASGGTPGPGTVGTTELADDAVTYAKMQDVAATSVVGRASGGSGDPEAITASADGQVMRRAGGSLAFGTLGTTSYDDASVTYAKLQNVAATSLMGRASGSSGVAADITASANNQVLVRQSGSLVFATLDTASIGSGQLSVTRGGTGVDGSAAANGSLLIGNGSGYTLATLTAGSGVSITNGGGSITIAATGGAGTVTSVGLSLPAIFSVSGSPVTGSGTLTATLATQAVNTVWAGPTTGGAAAPTFRNLVAADLPSHVHSAADVTSGTLAIARGGTGQGTAPVNGQLLIGNAGAWTLSGLTAGTGISVTTGAGSITVASTGVTSVGITAGSGISVSGSPITTTGSMTVAVDINGLTATDVALDDSLPIYDLSATANRKLAVNRLLGTLPLTPGGRLTLGSGNPVPSSDATGTTTLYYIAYLHDRIVLWDGTRWVAATFTEQSLAPILSASTVYDVFGYLSSGVLAIEILAWTNDTTRATGVSLQDGRYCKTGDKTRLYLGSVRTTASSQFEDSAARRLVWNHYNRAERHLYAADTSTASHTYNGTWRESNAGSTDGTTRFAFLCGLAEVAIEAVNLGATKCNSVNSYSIGIGLDSSTTASGVKVLGYSGGTATSADPVIACVTAAYRGFPGVGYHTLRRLEQSSGATTTWYGVNGNSANFQSGMYGTIRG
jgi:hypothetical protein